MADNSPATSKTRKTAMCGSAFEGRNFGRPYSIVCPYRPCTRLIQELHSGSFHSTARTPSSPQGDGRRPQEHRNFRRAATSPYEKVQIKIRRQFLQYFAKNGDVLAKYRALIESQVKISKSKTEYRFHYGAFVGVP
ncbi:uncharacterized protein N7498_007393 [Penicillium cinerascens]|uniref:Uncharacterized protein n=1 Tax=Penicillium cinerascens TaxID=70096 RepID=A0A9W9JLH8_9EURO|nr:uncharacterized protein N7498_007393 [Penicillium cinerascens]KAJ5198276.1 hypothetical protein N7498_007393 [Penicillium cinerascens]